MGHSFKYPVKGMCETYIYGKKTGSPFTVTPNEKKAKRLLQIISSDVCGPIHPPTHDGMKYFVTYIDHYSHFGMVYLMKNKSDTFSCFQKFVNYVNKRVKDVLKF
jgi:hypothetical protein